jgi:Na+-transporting NADH:ubiquinone oxidoreductase subunit NqrD
MMTGLLYAFFEVMRSNTICNHVVELPKNTTTTAAYLKLSMLQRYVYNSHRMFTYAAIIPRLVFCTAFARSDVTTAASRIELGTKTSFTVLLLVKDSVTMGKSKMRLNILLTSISSRS